MRIELKPWLGRTGLVLTASFLMVGISSTGQTSKQSGAGKSALEVVSVGMKVVQDTKPLAIVSWKVVVKNQTTHDIHLFGEVSLRDADDYEVNGDVFWGDINGGEQKSFTEELTITSEELARTKNIVAKVQER